MLAQLSTAGVKPGSTVTDEGVSFSVWAPEAHTVTVELSDLEPLALGKDAGGYFSGHSARAGHGTRYGYCLDGGAAYPDPYSRFLPQGPEGPSMVIDPRYDWSDAAVEGA